MSQEIYQCTLADSWEKYEASESIKSKIENLKELKDSINYHNSLTSVTHLKKLQERFILELLTSVNQLEDILNQPVINKNLQKEAELQLLSKIFSFIEFEKTISDFKSEQLWKITRTFLILMIIFIITTVILIFSNNSAKQRAKRHKELNNLIIKVQEDERERLSRELHDTVTQDIRTSLLFVRNLKEKNIFCEKDDENLLNKIETLETQNLINIRNIIKNLTPPEIETANLHNLLADYCTSVNQRTKLKCTFYAESGLNFNEFNNFQKLNIFRIVQESITNSIKHADATEINIIVRRKSENSSTFVFFISDDGHGFNFNEKEFFEQNDITDNSTHLGLKGIKSRAQLINAKLNIYSDEDCGTEIRFEI